MKYHSRILLLLFVGASVFLGFLVLFASTASRDLEYSSRAQRRHKLCVLVPFRDRWEELLVFIPHLSSFLTNQGVFAKFLVINQSDSLRFNRASLINVGFAESPSDCDYFAIHDVDLIPLNSQITYNYPNQGPLHLTSPGLHPKYDYPTFFGGILLITKEDFIKVNGMSNNYWGWGLEDDEFRARIIDADLAPQKQSNILTGKDDTFEHLHFREERTSRDMANCYNQKDVTHYRDRKGGLNTIDYSVKHRRDMSVDSSYFTLIDAVLKCDKSKTPWCSCMDASEINRKFKVDDDRRKDLILPKIPKKRLKKKNF
ncbi:beta-1,4-galactosyltransferase 7 [Lepeophtheirus salmonis]|uniref:beta-1,4-galactosyltransferase 7 n=1 Tax=Lepeophtheirus salmonis TaxID=72036 RepID=UPI001AE7628C|nr:xylosylprotein 4-beta-galactosyltransferase-like [Lepeophtheirus salmonis]